MSELYQKQGFELKFLGVMNGFSQSHTNAYFFPDSETLAFIDLSMYNFEKAKEVMDAHLDKLKRVILFLTHTHDDHISGVTRLAFHVRHKLPNAKLEVLCGSLYIHDVYHVCFGMGARPLIGKNGKSNEILRIYGQTVNKKIVSRWNDQVELLVDQTFLEEQNQFVIPDWFIKTIPTTHCQRLLGSSGFAFMLNGKAVIFTGDTNASEHFYELAEKYSTEAIGVRPIPTELYMDMETVETGMHLFWEDEKKNLERLLRRTSTLKVILMHCNDYESMQNVVSEMNLRIGGEPRLFVAEEE